MKIKTKAIIAICIFLLIFLGGAVGQSIVSKEMLERQENEEGYEGFILNDVLRNDQRFSPREYIKVIPIKER
ncbi:hypothetical protein HXA34_08275 [Salipaludibacillus agaradhaerens]|jgi:outer membrane lipoprotein-sorting protein|uniref:Uncharacterized protein n=1 Tax=Salipaludibacillus agaradhaerens TaxID=76935 RepID=A0A9Q4B262_SALAG|nr:hypothetical protein [Salipaludibacillus agaradhaerens]UJW57417.1 hypothetical protein HXZ66_08400 [Bacillus sp. A116_S68]MCR6096821.1 hypothetical protein [Salipaludibacillus agaradhaerens]MCR6106276.1 hypothetical protein [Salipaludibacillus agaradhaerens]MCR6113620.1 hypothetical protein [Salipaludibacillus agaradhaerens]MCR6118309.1 hypothetical protein [Salipaludibacillus agaradhaerens]